MPKKLLATKPCAECKTDIYCYRYSDVLKRTLCEQCQGTKKEVQVLPLELPKLKPTIETAKEAPKAMETPVSSVAVSTSTLTPVPPVTEREISMPKVNETKMEMTEMQKQMHERAEAWQKAASAHVQAAIDRAERNPYRTSTPKQDSGPIPSVHMATHSYYIGYSDSEGCLLVSQKLPSQIFQVVNRKDSKSISKSQFDAIVASKPSWQALTNAYGLRVIPALTSIFNGSNRIERMKLNEATVLF